MRARALACAFAVLVGLLTIPTASRARSLKDGIPRRRPSARAVVHRIVFRGITLSGDQQASLWALERRQAANSPAARQVMPDTERLALEAARARRDTATIHRIVRANRSRLLALCDQAIDEIRGELTKDQQPQFDQNVARLEHLMYEQFPRLSR